MNAIELLTRDHQAVKALFAELEAETSGGGRRADLLGRLHLALDLHAALEEELFYPAVEETAEDEESRELVRGARQDHAVMRMLLADLSAIDALDERFSGKARVLRENVERHVAEEESLVLPAFRQRVSAEDLELLGEQMEARKVELASQLTGVAPTPVAASEARHTASPEQRTRLVPAGRRSRSADAGPRAPRRRRSVGGRRKSSKRRAAATRGRP